MAALNCCFFGIDGVIMCGDTLRMDHHRAWETHGTILGGEVREVDPDDVAWPEAVFEDAATDAGEAESEDRLAVNTDASEFEQSDLEAWED